MKISIIVAMAENRVIGINNSLPWKLSSDMRWFRQHTLGKPIIMGRKTFESIACKPLPDRQNIIVTHNARFSAENCDIANSLDAAFDIAHPAAEVMIIGGASFYAQSLPRTQRLYVTRVHATVDGDAWFPEYNESDWEVISQQSIAMNEDNPIAHSFQILERKPA